MVHGTIAYKAGINAAQSGCKSECHEQDGMGFCHEDRSLPDHKRATHHASCTPQSRHQQIYFSVATLSAIIVDKCKPEVINKEHSALLLP